MKPERKNGDTCVRIGFGEASEEYLLSRDRLFFVIEVVGVPLPPGLETLPESEVPPLPIPRTLFHDPDATCDFLLACPRSLLNPHLVPEILPEEIKRDIP